MIFASYYHQQISPVGCIFSDCTSVDIDGPDSSSIEVGTILPGESKYYKYHITNQDPNFQVYGIIEGTDGGNASMLCINDSDWGQLLPDFCDASDPDYYTGEYDFVNMIYPKGSVYCADSGYFLLGVHLSPDAPDSVAYALTVYLDVPYNSMDCGLGSAMAVMMAGGALAGIFFVCGIPLLILSCAFVFKWYYDYKQSRQPVVFDGCEPL